MTIYRIFFVFGLLCITATLFIFARQHFQRPVRSFSYSVTDSEKQFKIKADYPAANYDEVCAYLEDQLGPYTNLSFGNTEIDGQVVLDNRVSFYLVTAPGKLRITFNKRENSLRIYEQFRQMGNELRDVTSLP